MPFLSDEELAARLNSPDNLKNKLSLILEPLAGVGSRGKEVPTEIKKVVTLLASDHEREERQEDIAKAFNIPQSSVSKFSMALHNFGSKEINPELKRLVDKNQAKRETAETKAIDTLLTTLDIIPNKLSENTSIKTLSVLAKSMSEVADRMAGRNNPQANTGQQVHLHIFVPKQKDVSDYDVIDV